MLIPIGCMTLFVSAEITCLLIIITQAVTNFQNRKKKIVIVVKT